MKQAHSRLRIPSLTVLQLMKLVVLGAVPSACLSFGAQLAKEGVSKDSPWLIFVMEGLLIPLVLAMVAFPMLRKGQLKDWLIRVLVATSVSVATGSLILATVEEIRYRLIVRRQPFDYAGLGVATVVIVLFSLTLSYLSRGIIPARCPGCRRMTLLPDANFRVRSEARQGRSYQCLGCRGQFRNPRGFWEAIPTGPGEVVGGRIDGQREEGTT
jgi:hypothetical protein